ncbi:MAG: hypothetical protein OEY16_01725, partial [Alphaproteobacteria bacterium]|nr:hypothetical protein [Alphaproteobacteria bacterium]
LITAEMVETICGATMKMSTRGRQAPDRCNDKLFNVDMQNGNVIYFTVKTYPDNAEAVRQHERWKKAALSNSTPEKVAKNKAEGSLYTASFTDVAEIGGAAYERHMYTPDTKKSRIQLDILTGHHNVEVNSDMWTGAELPCDSDQLQAIAKEVVKTLGH